MLEAVVPGAELPGRVAEVHLDRQARLDQEWYQGWFRQVIRKWTS